VRSIEYTFNLGANAGFEITFGKSLKACGSAPVTGKRPSAALDDFAQVRCGTYVIAESDQLNAERITASRGLAR